MEWRRRGREAALAGLDQHLLTGFGFGRPVRFVFLGRIQDVTGNPHNSYVYILAGGGVLALGALLAVMLAYVVDVLRRLRRAVGVEQMPADLVSLHLVRLHGERVLPSRRSRPPRS